MSIEKMSLAEVTGDLSMLDEVLFRCLVMGNLQPEEASTLADLSGGFVPVVEENPYTPLLNKAMRIGAILGVDSEEETPKQAKEKSKCVNMFYHKIRSTLNEVKPTGSLLIQELEKVKKQVNQISRADWVHLGLSCRLSTVAMKAWTGTIATKFLEKTESWDKETTICHEVLRNGKVSWILVFADVDKLEQVEQLLIDINFREVAISPREVSKNEENGLPVSVNERLDDLSNKQRHLLEKIDQNKGKIQQAGQQAGEQLGIDNIATCKFLKTRFGLLPTESFRQLEKYKDQPFIYSPISKEGQYQWGVYISTEEHIKEIDKLFSSLGFDRIWMPALNTEKSRSRIDGWTAFLERFQDEMLALTDQRKALTAEIEQYENALVHLKHVVSLDVSFEDLFSCRYIKIRFGRLPQDSYDKLKYYDQRPFIFRSFDVDDQYRWGVYFTTREHTEEIDDIFASLYFERVKIPEFVHGTPEAAVQGVKDHLKELKRARNHLEAQVLQCSNQHREYYYDIYAMSKYLSDSFSLRRFVGKVENTFRIVGFVPEKEAEAFQENLTALGAVQIDVIPPDSDKRLKVPTKLRNSRFAKPFEMFVEMYGLPSYKDIDPTPILAVSYTLLFGIMFGDLGQGLVMALLGWFLSSKNGQAFGKILIRLGLSSSVFGLAYGSVFGLENLLDPMFRALGFAKKPIEVMEPATINVLLIAAISLGVVLILISMFINIFMGFKERNYERAVFGNNGLAGLVFYTAVLGGLVLNLVLGINLFSPLYDTFFIALPLVLMFFKGPLGKLVKHGKGLLSGESLGSFLIEGFFELFEVVLSFVTNTISFLRVGGFIISHAGMMTVVLTLTGMVNGGASVLVLIIGNIFVMALEGLIVGIQCLRLEFYEMFSRYFEGNGDAFKPVHIGDKLL